MEFLAALGRRGIAFALLGRVEGYPDTIASDVDFLVHDHDLASMPALMQEVASRSGGWLVQCLQHEIGAAYYVIAVAAGSSIAYLPLDASGSYRRRGRLWLDAAGLLRRRCLNGAGYPVLAPADAFAYYLIKRVGKRSLDEPRMTYLREVFEQDPPGVEQLLAERFGAELTARVRGLLATKGPVEPGAIDLLARMLERSAPPEPRMKRLRAALGEWRRRWTRLREPTGLVLAFLGPDGAGKSTLIRGAEAALSPAFRGYVYFHLRPGLLIRGRSAAAAAAARPHAQVARGMLGSIVKLCAIVAEYNAGWWVRVWPRKVRSSLVIFDRYFQDMLCDPARYRWAGPRRLLEAVALFVPRPDLWFVLDAPAEVLQARKQEVSLEASREQRAAYRRLADGLGAASLIDTSGDAQACVSEIRDVVLVHMARRLEARLHLEPGTGDR